MNFLSCHSLFFVWDVPWHWQVWPRQLIQVQMASSLHFLRSVFWGGLGTVKTEPELSLPKISLELSWHLDLSIVISQQWKKFILYLSLGMVPGTVVSLMNIVLLIAFELLLRVESPAALASVRGVKESRAFVWKLLENTWNIVSCVTTLARLKSVFSSFQ